MSTMALQLPSSFVDVEREEMEYIDGGNALYDLAVCVLGGAVWQLIYSEAVHRGITYAMVRGFIASVGGEIGEALCAAAADMWNAFGYAILAGTVAYTAYKVKLEFHL